MTLPRIARFNSIPDASWFLARKARELTEYAQVLPSDMLFIAHGAGGLWTISKHLAKQMLPFRKIDNVVDGVAAICQMPNMQVNAAPRPYCFVLLSVPLRERLEHLCRYLQSSDEVKQTYLSICLDAHVDSDTLSFHLDAELSPIVGSLEPGTVYFRKSGENWFCEWPDRPAWMVPHLLVTICGFLATHQRAFLENGVKQIGPLKMADVAANIGCHVTSVSRVISGVEAQTDWGRFPLKTFFSGSIQSDEGPLSQVQMKAKILEIIESEDKLRPLSDEAITQLLKVQGVSLSRRGVTKYRSSLGISSTRQRRIKRIMDG